jgi:DNA-binding NarL/FixJ family response regulator
MSPVRILIADSHSTFLKSISAWLTLVPSLEVVGRTRSGSAALELALQLSPDLVLVGWFLRDISGTEVTRRIKTLQSEVMVIIMALDDLPAYRAAALASGADGFVAKPELAKRLLPLILGLFA